MDKLRDDLESTKQLLELELRSKKLLEKDNKRLAQELERLRQEIGKGGTQTVTTTAASETAPIPSVEEAKLQRRNSTILAAKRNSVIRLLSESEGPDDTNEIVDTKEPLEDMEEEENSSSTAHEQEVPIKSADKDLSKKLVSMESSETNYDEEIADIEEMREEVDEARKLAEEWEAKYKEMQRQMSDLESSRYKRQSLIIDSLPMTQKKASVTSEFEGKSLRTQTIVTHFSNIFRL